MRLSGGQKRQNYAKEICKRGQASWETLMGLVYHAVAPTPQGGRAADCLPPEGGPPPPALFYFAIGEKALCFIELGVLNDLGASKSPSRRSLGASWVLLEVSRRLLESSWAGL